MAFTVGYDHVHVGRFTDTTNRKQVIPHRIRHSTFVAGEHGAVVIVRHLSGTGHMGTTYPRSLDHPASGVSSWKIEAVPSIISCPLRFSSMM